MRNHPRWLPLAMILGALVALLAFAACGGGDDDDSGGSNTPTATHAGGASNTGGATETSEATEPASTDDVLDELSSLGEDIQQVTGKVTYQQTDTDGSVTNVTFYSKPPNARFESTDENGDTTIYITTPDWTYSCSSSEQTCIQLPGTGTDSSGLGVLGAVFSPAYIDALVSAAELSGIEVDKSSDNIAGQDATCFSGTDNGETDRFCFSDSGVLLLTQTESSEGTYKMEATDYSSDVPDSDFEPPYPATTIPTG